MDQKNITLLVCVGIVLAAGAYVYWCTKKEGYANANSLSNVGIIDNYDLVNHPSPDSVADAAHFADIIDQGNQDKIVKQPTTGAQNMMDRFNRLADSKLLPQTAAGLTPYNVEVANPQTYSFAVTNPRVQLKNRLAMQADPYRGDIPITYHPNVAMIGKSQYDRDSLKYSAMFNPAYDQTFHRDTGRGFGYMNMPVRVAAEETIADY